MDYKNLKYSISNGCDRGLCHQACGRQDRQLNTYDWLACLAMLRILTSWRFSSRTPARATTTM